MILAACIIAGSALCGRAVAGGAHRREALLIRLLSGIKALKVRMVSRFEPVRNALEQSECPLLRRVGEEMALGASAAEAWQKVKQLERRRGRSAEGLEESDAEILDRLFEHLGESGREEQELLLTETVQSVEAMRNAAQTQTKEADKLCVSLGVLIGMLLALIII